MVKIEKFTLINNDISRIKLFEPSWDASQPSSNIDAMMISNGGVHKKSSNPIMKGSKLESIEEGIKEYKQLLNEGWKKTIIFKRYL